MEKLPTIILPASSEADAASASPRAGVSLGPWEQPRTPTSKSLLRFGGIRLRCPRPQQLVEDFYVKRLGMQELVLSSSPPPRPGAAVDTLDFRLVLPQKQQLHQLLQQSSFRSQHRRPSASSSRHDFGAALGEELGGNKGNLREHEGYASRGGSRRTSFSSQYSSRNTGIATFPGANRFVAFEFFSSPEIEAAITEASEAGEVNTPPTPAHKNWFKHSFGQFVLECVPVQKLQGLYKPYEHHRSDVFSRLAFCVSDVNAAALDLSQHMIRVQPAGQFLDMAYAASFLDPHNFRGRLLQYMSEYKMVSRKVLLTGEAKGRTSSPQESASKRPPAEKDKRPDSEHSDSPGAPSEEGGDSRTFSSPLSSTYSSTASSAASLLQAEREGTLS